MSHEPQMHGHRTKPPEEFGRSEREPPTRAVTIACLALAAFAVFAVLYVLVAQAIVLLFGLLIADFAESTRESQPHNSMSHADKFLPPDTASDAVHPRPVRAPARGVGMC